MKHFLLITWFALICLGFTNVGISQSKILAKGWYDQDQNSVAIRWISANFIQMKHANIYGYTILRVQTHSVNGTELSLQDLNSSLISYQVLPYTTSQWQPLLSQDSSKVAAAKFLLSNLPIMVNGEELIDADSLTERKLFHAYHAHETQESQYNFTLMLADQDFDIAKGLALGFVDSLVTPGAKYRYTITLNQKNIFVQNFSLGQYPYSGVLEISADSISSLAAPTELTAQTGDKNISLTWSVSGIEDSYTYYNIYRSVNAGDFIKVNETPYIYMSQDTNSHLVTYKDSIPQNGIPYTYRVRGLSPFGGEGPYSDPVTVTGVPDPLPLAIEIKNLEMIHDSLVIVWETYSKKDSLVPDLTLVTGYEIVHSADLKAPPVLVKHFNGSNTKTGTLANAADGYYFVEAIDSFGYRYPSIPHLFQGVDSIAPSQPSGLTAELKADGTARLRWQASTEADLAGYRVFYSYHPDGPYTQMTSDNVTATEYVTKSLTDNANAKVYYKIKAIDKRDNTSLLSDQALLVLPDVSGPSKPVLSHAIPRPEGIRIGWSLSKDEDLDRHVLQRRVSEAVEWTDILEISNGVSYPALPITQAEVNPSRYVDTTKLQLRYYEYRLEAYDSTGNSSVSDIITIKPYDDGNRGEIRTFEAVIVKKMDDYIPNVPMQGTSGISQTNLTNTNIGVNNQGLVQGSMKSNGLVAKLNWEYDTAFPSSLETFSIYQKTSPPPIPGRPSEVPQTPFVLIKTISAQQAAQIALLNNGSGYMFFVEGLNPTKLINPVNNPSNESIKSPVILDAYQYKVIANHKGGGKSTESVTPLTK